MTLIESVEAVVYVFGALLLYVAYRAFRGAAEQSDPSATRCCGSSAHRPDLDGCGRRLFVREAGRRYGTPLLLVVVAIIVADIAFAVDSIPAAFAVTRDPVVIWTANAFALLGLGALLVLVELLVRRFAISTRRSRSSSASSGSRSSPRSGPHQRFASLAIIGALLAGGTVASLIADRLDPPQPRRRLDVRLAARNGPDLPRPVKRSKVGRVEAIFSLEPIYRRATELSESPMI